MKQRADAPLADDKMGLDARLPQPLKELHPVDHPGGASHSDNEFHSGKLGVGRFFTIIDRMLRRQRTGSVICTSCGVLVGVNDATCYNCGRRNPGLWGFAPVLRTLGADLGLIPFIIASGATLHLPTRLSRGRRGGGGSPPARPR